MRIKSNVSVTILNRETGVVRTVMARNHNFITNISKLLDLVDGSATDHINSAGRIVLKTATPTTIKTLTSMVGGFPSVPSSKSVSFRWQDATTDVYTAANVDLATSTGVKVAEALNTGWAAKGSVETWTFTWTLSITTVGSGWTTAGINDLLKCITGASSSHWDGTEGSTNTEIKVYNGSPGTLQFTQVTTAAITRTSTSLKWTFARSSGAATWARVVLRNNGSSVQLYDDDITDKVQATGDIFTYALTLDLSGVPLTPTGLLAGDELGDVRLDWTDVATNEDNYAVQRALSGGGYADLTTTLPAGSISYLDTTAVVGVAYDYRVYCTNAYGGSAFSNVVTITI